MVFLLCILFFTWSNRLNKKCARTFEENVFELKHKIANDMKESYLEIDLELTSI